METLVHLIAVYGLLVVFVSVFLDQGGLPVPAYPPIIVTAALAVDQGKSLWPILVVAAGDQERGDKGAGDEGPAGDVFDGRDCDQVLLSHGTPISIQLRAH